MIGISLGGYYAPRIASMERRYKACVAWGACWDYHATWKKRVAASMQTELSVPGHHILWIFNTTNFEDTFKKLEAFRLDGVVQKMRCPFLLTHGIDDKQVPARDARNSSTPWVRRTRRSRSSPSGREAPSTASATTSHSASPTSRIG